MTEQAPPGAQSSRIGRLALFCCDHARAVALAGLALGFICLLYAAGHFAMNTDTNALISRKLPWRVRETAYNHLFHPGGDQTVVVIDGKTPELAEGGAAAITAGLESRPDLFSQVTRPDGGPFFAKEGLLFLSVPEVRSRMADLISAQPFLGPIAADPSLRGLMGVLSTAAQGAGAGQTTLADIAGPMSRLAQSLDQTLAGHPAPFSWTNLIRSGKPKAAELRRFVVTTPRLDYARFSAGAAADAFIRRLAVKEGLDPAHGVTVRLTGAAPLADQQLASLAKGVDLIAALALAAILLMLWLAVRSARLIGAILVTMF
ncbi:MAG: MMPL family transporter, partial [Gemmatimonadales bacterium]